MVDYNFMRRMAPFLVLEILKNHTDEEHGLKVSQIVALMEEDYGITLNRKAVSSILNDLLELSEIPQEYSWKNPMKFSIKFDVVPRSSGDIRENWRLCKEFEEGEIRLLTDLVKTVPGYPHRRLLEKLQRLGGVSMQNRSLIQESRDTVNHQMPVNMDYIERAIQRSRKIIFDYDTHEQYHTVSPYKMVFRNGNYYLICYDEDIEDMALFRVEKIKNAVPLEEPAKDYRTVSTMARWNYSVDAYLEHYIFGNLEN
jgi:hypothetical protein